jgi:hypothetical protein
MGPLDGRPIEKIRSITGLQPVSSAELELVVGEPQWIEIRDIVQRCGERTRLGSGLLRSATVLLTCR